MPNAFDYGGRGPSNTRLFVAGVALFMITLVIAALMIAKYKGRLDPMVRVTAELTNVGDGLPAKSDVKFHGVLVGSVSSVIPAGPGRPNIVHIDLKPHYAAAIPDTITARVVPSNVFAVSSVQLVDNTAESATLRAGAVIHEDKTLPTVLFQTTLNKLRQVLAAVGRAPNRDSIGVLTAVGEATQGRGNRLEHAGRDLNDIVTQLNSVIGDDSGPSTLSALITATNGLRTNAPDLFDALARAVKPMQTLAEKRSELTNLVSSGLGALGKVADGFDHQTDRLINITSELTPVMGVLAGNVDGVHGLMTRLVQIQNTFYNEAWNPETNQLLAKIVVSLTPTRTYVRADCPRYGELAGPSCQTAPEIPVAPALTPALGSMGFPLPPGTSENRPNFAPPRGSVLPRDPNVTAPPDQAWPPSTSGPQPSTPPLPAEAPPPTNPPSPPAITSPPVPAPSVQPQAATVIGGNVGPVGSRQEKDQLSLIVGAPATAATELLLGPIARGATVHMAPDPGGGR
jgi:virulence factor Mce-like protein